MTMLRREALILIGAGLAGGARAADATKATDFAFETPEGGPMPLSAYAGKPILVVNTATACGYAGQLSGLQALWTRFGDRGLTVIGVPSPDFGNQEPLDGPAIAEAARKNHGVTFPITAKARVKMPGAIRSTAGPRRSARARRRAGTSTNTSSPATAPLRLPSPPRSSPPIRG